MCLFAGAGVLVFIQACFLVGFLWSVPKAWRWVVRHYKLSTGLDWGDE